MIQTKKRNKEHLHNQLKSYGEFKNLLVFIVVNLKKVLLMLLLWENYILQRVLFRLILDIY